MRTGLIGTALALLLACTPTWAATAPGAPSTVKATAGNAQATVTFKAPTSNGGSPITGYTVTSSPAGGVDSNAGTTGLSHIVTGLVNGTAYTFTVKATNAIGTSVASTASASITPATVPGIPTIGTATGGNAKATITFTAPTSNGGSAITSYTATSTPGSKTGTCTVSPCTVSTLTNGTAYTFTIKATNAKGAGSASAASNSTTPATVPGAPTGLTATGGNAQATVAFTAPASNGGSAITGYSVTSLPAGGVDSNAGATSLSHLITGLTNGTAYTFTVKAANAKGSSVASTASNSVTPVAPVPPTVIITSPAANTVATAPASFTLTANASSTTSTIAKVEFFNGATLLGTGTAAPYTYVWSNVAAGSYSITAVATDVLNSATTSSAIPLTVNSGVAQAYYIYADHLDTPRQITDTAGNVVWQWDNSDPFGNNPPNENPSGLGAFTCNLGFPGQYRDRETNTFYNTYRDAYDTATGRYSQFDPIGLRGGINGYIYALSNPLRYTDILGLEPDQICVTACTVGGALVGGSIGQVGGGVLGGLIGGAGGTLVAPGAGTVGGAAAGAAAGSQAGSAAGAAAGAAAGNAAGKAMCPDNCEKEWREARNSCRKLIYEQMQQQAGRRKKRSVTGVTGGYTDVEECARGLVSEQCGGNKVDR
jgi:RHS repeat-associated protein